MDAADKRPAYLHGLRPGEMFIFECASAGFVMGQRWICAGDKQAWSSGVIFEFLRNEPRSEIGRNVNLRAGGWRER